MKRSKIKIGVARKVRGYSIERYPAHILKIARKMQFEVWNVIDHTMLTSGTLDEIRAWAAEKSYILTPTNHLGEKTFEKVQNN